MMAKMPMNKPLARQLARQAFDHLKDTSPKILAWVRGVGPHTFRNLRLKQFLSNYCWVVYESGFKFSIVEQKFPFLEVAFNHFDPEALSRMRSIKGVLAVFNNERKASNFLSGAKSIVKEGFIPFKKRLGTYGVDTLLELPGIGQITKNHLAKNIGLADVPKADTWLQRAATQCDTSVPELVDYAAGYLGESRHTADVAIWAFGKDGMLKGFQGRS